MIHNMKKLQKYFRFWRVQLFSSGKVQFHTKKKILLKLYYITNKMSEAEDRFDHIFLSIAEQHKNGVPEVS